MYSEKSIKYGGNNDIINTCPRCGKSCDNHKFQYIEPNEKTDLFVRKMQSSLDETSKRAALKNFDKSRDTCMVGSAIATINNGVYTYVTISGGNVALLNYINNNFGKDVVIIDKPSALPLKTIKGQPLNPNPTRRDRGRDYPVGSCAAQKLLMAVFEQAAKSGGYDKITKLNMSELLWNDPVKGEHNRDWSTGSIVCSCDTCKQVVPMMLCDKEEV
ncbi:hypothetical protein NIES4075_69330 [Tolypothrix sp. NIES-4075]|uniref:hypothetical protein n=1 Tax=Tolypothrix sp. NIES-4075 TaxID=2005459 RepID=UPI000B5CACA2|nr:hypothetical protein [Tolypothrix sp. NIES-4075]GAX45912.1 hypothetical protein NIES4075_69330 [Tolypothrix sp. NIES-4075]